MLPSTDAANDKNIGELWMAHVMGISNFLRLTHLTCSPRVFQILYLDTGPASMWHARLGPFAATQSDSLFFRNRRHGRKGTSEPKFGLTDCASATPLHDRNSAVGRKRC
jgi:hypothetical protein